MTNEKKELRIFCRWEPERREFYLWGRDEGGVEQSKVIFTLFSWHKPSFYGTFLDEIDYRGHQAVRLSPFTAFTFFNNMPESEFFRVRLDHEINHLIQAAKLIKEMLVTGKWMPDFHQWQGEKGGWKLKSPSKEQKKYPVPFLEDWANGIITEIINTKKIFHENWMPLLRAYPQIMQRNLADVYDDEEEWLEAIGWHCDNNCPFTACLQLAEPGKNPAWTLGIILQDKENPGLAFPYSENPEVGREAVPEEWRHYLPVLKRSIKKWQKVLPTLADPSSPLMIKKELTEEEAWEFLTAGSEALIRLGARILLPAWWEEVRKSKTRIKAKRRNSGTPSGLLGVASIIQFDWKIAIRDVELSPEDFKRLVQQKRRLLKFKDRWIYLDPAFANYIRKVLRDKKNGMTFGEVLQRFLLGEELEEHDQEKNAENGAPVPVDLEIDAALEETLRGLTKVSFPSNMAIPQAFRGTLRKYQMQGFSWLLFLRRFGLGGCLADDMGLGKTIQFIAYLLAVQEKEKTPIPALLICPTSVIGNWQMELKRFAPSLSVYLHYGPQRPKGEAFLPSVTGKDLVITSYALANIDQEELASFKWNTLCLDEAQNIKNAYTKQAEAIKKFSAGHRIALTGTPMENRLTEIWSIMDFLNPGYLGGQSTFNRKFANMIEKQNDAEAVFRVQKLVRPFLLRRIKTDPAVELDLPEKQEQKEYISLTTEQAALYETVLNRMFEQLAHAEPMERRGIILVTLMKLKQVCNHPALLLKETNSKIESSRSGKVERLLEQVGEVREAGERCLIFTQFVEMGRMLQDTLEKKLGERVQFLHGGVPKNQRDAMIARLQDESLPREKACSVMILSLKAGGTGLNLTAANHVFHFDRWWNPAVENQATDRTYRIGQKKHVMVYKYISLGTVEERIDEMIDKKQGLNELIVESGENWITELSTEELKEVFTLRKEWVR